MAKDSRGKPLIIGPGGMIYVPPSADGYLLTFPQGVPKTFARLFPADPTRDVWAEDSPKEPNLIRLTTRQVSA